MMHMIRFHICRLCQEVSCFCLFSPRHVMVVELLVLEPVLELVVEAELLEVVWAPARCFRKIVSYGLRYDEVK